MSNSPIEKISTVRLGTEGPQIGVQGFGAMGISEFYGDTDEAAARDTLEATVEAGVTLIDTADVYGSGANEEFLAPFLAAHRDEVTLATKFAIERRADDPHYRAINNSPGIHQEGRRGEPAPSRHRDHRPLLHAPPRPADAARRVRRRDGRAGPRGQGQVPGPERGHRRRAARGVRRAPDRRPPVGVVGLQPRRRAQRGSGRRRARRRLRAVLAARPRLSDRGVRRREQGARRRATSASSSPASPGTTPRPTRPCSNRSTRSRPRTARRPRRSRWPGCSSGPRCTA